MFIENEIVCGHPRGEILKAESQGVGFAKLNYYDLTKETMMKSFYSRIVSLSNVSTAEAFILSLLLEIKDE